jgi:hypothetical protein
LVVVGGVVGVVVVVRVVVVVVVMVMVIVVRVVVVIVGVVVVVHLHHESVEMRPFHITGVIWPKMVTHIVIKLVHDHRLSAADSTMHVAAFHSRSSNDFRRRLGSCVRAV